MESSPNAQFPDQLKSVAGVLEHISDGFFALDCDWRFVFMNGLGLRLMNRTLDSLEGKVIWDAFPDAVGSVYQVEYERAVRESRPVRFEAFYPPLDSWLSISAHPSEMGLWVYFRDITERRKSQEALMVSEARFRSMVENLPAGAVFREGERLWLNPAAERITGYSQDEIRTVQEWFEKIYPEDPVEARTNYETLRSSGFQRPEMCVVTRKDKSKRYAEFTAYSDDRGEIWLIHDVTDRLTTEEKFRILFEFSNSAYFLFGRNGVTDCNPAALKQLGFTDKNDVIGRFFISFSPDVQADGMPSSARLSEVNKELYDIGQTNFEWTHFRSDGSLAQVYVSASKVTVGVDEMELVVWQDLTHIRHTEDRLRQSEARYRTIIENTDEIIYTLSFDGTFTYVSPSWTRHLGHSVDEVLGKKFVDFVHPDDRAKGTIYTLRLFRDASYRGSCMYRAIHKDGMERWHETSGTLVIGGAGNPLHFVGLTHDVTEKLHAREALEEARDAALASSRAKSQFLATVSHEIRTPLNGVLGMTNLLSDTPLKDEQIRYVKAIQASGEILRRVIDDVLDYSRIEAGKLTISPLAIDVIEALNDVVSIFQGAAQEKGISLHLDCDKMTSMQVYADPARIKQVVANLVSNAVKFTERGGVSVNARIVHDAPTAVIFRIEVVDSGIGIKTERAEAIFEGFTQADNSMHRRYGGSGLGLTISKRITDLMGGTIGVESHFGTGSRFWVELPLSKITRFSAPQPHIDRLANLEGLRILLAEDNLVNVEVAKIQLENLGCVVEVAFDGNEVLAKMETNAFDMILMDIQMPEMDGLEATREIRNRETEADGRIPIIALTATAFAEDKKACEDAGMDGFLSKPFKRSELEMILRQWAVAIEAQQIARAAAPE
ncbi:MAG: PAS domain S-box protein [Fimbriimonas sp.]|nr:PAS domain S-box protein [Fimbriimonas sp.]